ncbi:MAG: nodulation protein NfeD [Ignavibacteriaceae bacterium]|nr:nodulation protein NfeD [Ignavibacteriaceae bacterium]
MKKYLLFFFVLLFSLSVFPQKKKVMVARIDGTIDLGLAPFVQRVINEAEEKNYNAVIFEINTFGGRVDAATQIKDAIVESDILTIAFVNKRAISAGALISISCKKIAMAKGSSIGATTVVDEGGNKVSEKYQSYMRGEMRATAERNGRRTDIAEGMVDERVVVPGLVNSTQLITLTTDEAIKWGYCDTVANNLKEVLAAFDLKGATVTYAAVNWAEEVVRFINHPVISSLLIMLGLVGLFTEIKTPGWGIAGTIGILALAIFFGTSFILQLASSIEIILFIVGVILLALEIFVVPGFGFTGIGGIVLIIGSIFFSLFDGEGYYDWDILNVAIIQLAGALIGGLILILIIFKYLPKSKTFDQFVHHIEEKADKGFTSGGDYTHLVGMEAVTVTDHRPAGAIKIGDQKYDSISDGEYIEKNKAVKIVRTEGVKIVIKLIS